MLLPPDPPAPKTPENPTTPISRDEIQIGLLNKLVSSVTDLRNDVADVKTDVADVKTDVKQVEQNLGLVSNDLGLVKERISLVEKRQDESEKRADQNSIRVKLPSSVDLETQAQLAQQIAAREELAKKFDALVAADGPIAAIAKKVDSHSTEIGTVKTDLSNVSTQVVAVDKKTDAQTVILNRLDVIAKNPIVKAIGLALLMALAQYLGTKGIHVALPQ